MRFLIISILVIVAIGLTFWNFFPRVKTGPAALQVFSKPEGVQVFIDDKTVGVTPYKNQGLSAGEIRLSIGTEAARFAKTVRLTPGVFTIVNRELSDNPFLQAGEVLSLEAGFGLVVLSTPEGAEVTIDEQKMGATPVKFTEISPGAHKVVISAENYTSRSVQIQIHDNYRLILDVSLASTQESLAKTLGPTQGNLTPATLPKVKILDTPTGFLRVRDNPTLGGAEIAKVSPGEEYTLLEEKPGWFKIRLTDGRQGWVSAQYSQKT